MGGTSGKFRKALQSGDERTSEEIYFHNSEFQKSLDPNASYGENYDHNTPLHYAARYGMLKMLTIFLKQHKGNPNKRNTLDQTALHCICMDESFLLISSNHAPSQYYSQPPEKKRLECLKLLLAWRGITLQSGEQERADVNASDSDGNTPLHYAASSGYRSMVELLIEQNACLFTENLDKETPCDKSEKNRLFEIAQLLESKMVFCDLGKEDSVEDLSALQYEENYLGMRTQDVQEEKDQLLVETADMLRVPLFTAEALLRHYDWSRESLLEDWINDAQECCERSGVKPPENLEEVALEHKLSYLEHRTIRRAHRETCEICFTDIPACEPLIHLPCSHYFCKDCWQRYLDGKILEGSSHSILCPAFECFKLVPVEIIESIVSSEMAKRYLQFDIKAFVESNPNFKWCPMVGCGRAVKLPDNVDSPTQRGSSSPSSPPPMSRAVDCGSGHLFCWDCLREPHAPCSCENWKKWNDKIREIQPESLSGTEEDTEAAANCLWLVTNSKSCPKCNAPIQKNEGCNHMKCTKCKYDFCWVCLEPWNKHNSSTGGYFRCNRYEVVQKVEEKAESLLSDAEKKMKEMEELNRFLHYYTRYYNHGNSFNLEKPLVKKALGKMKNLACQAGKTGIKETRFIQSAIEELLKARSILRFSYPYGYYLEDKGSGSKQIFEFMQNELEESTETLSQMVARQFLRTPRSKIIHAMHLTTRKRSEFLSAVSKGFLPPDSPPSHRRRSTYQVQEDPPPWNDESEDDDEELRRAIEASIQDAMGSFASLASDSQESSPSSQKRKGKGPADSGMSSVSSTMMKLEMSHNLLMQQLHGLTPPSNTDDPSSPPVTTPELPTRRDKKLKRTKRTKHLSVGGYPSLSSFDYDIQRAMELSLQEARKQQEQPGTSQGDDFTMLSADQSQLKVNLRPERNQENQEQGKYSPSSSERKSKHSSPRPKSAILSSSRTSSKTSSTDYSKSSGKRSKSARHRKGGEGDQRGEGDDRVRDKESRTSESPHKSRESVPKSSNQRGSEECRVVSDLERKGAGDALAKDQSKDYLQVMDPSSTRRSRPSSLKSRSEKSSGGRSPGRSAKVSSSNSFSGKKSTYTFETAAYHGLLNAQSSPKKIDLDVSSRSTKSHKKTKEESSISSVNIWERMEDASVVKGAAGTQEKIGHAQCENLNLAKRGPKIDSKTTAMSTEFIQATNEYGPSEKTTNNFLATSNEIEGAVHELKSVGTIVTLNDQISQMISEIGETDRKGSDQDDKVGEDGESMPSQCLQPENVCDVIEGAASPARSVTGLSDERIMSDPFGRGGEMSETVSDPWILEDLELKLEGKSLLYHAPLASSDQTEGQTEGENVSTDTTSADITDKDV